MFENSSTLPLSFALTNNKMEDNNTGTGNVHEQFEDEGDGDRRYDDLPLYSPAPPPENTTTAIPKKKKKEKYIFNWRDDVVYYLINKWQEEPVLYNVKNPEYHDMTKRNLALERIWDGISIMEFQPLPTKEQNLEKMNGLRTDFNVQRNKMESSKESGTSTDAVYTPKWQFYDSLLFLQDMVTPRRTFSNMDDDDVNRIPSRINGPRRPKKTVETPGHELKKQATTVLKNQKVSPQVTPPPPPPPPQSISSDEHFGETVAKLMGEVPDGMNKDLLQLEIQRLIYQTKHNASYSGRSNFSHNSPPFGNFGNHSSYGVSGNPPSYGNSNNSYNGSPASTLSHASPSPTGNSVLATNVHGSPVYQQNFL